MSSTISLTAIEAPALVAELAKVGFQRSVEMLRVGAEAAGPDPVARYRALGRSYVRFAIEDTAYFRAIQNPEVRAAADEQLIEAEEHWFATIREGAEAARGAGWHPDEDPDALVAFSVAAAMGTAQVLSDPQTRKLLGVALDTPEQIDALADKVLDLVVHWPDCCQRPPLDVSIRPHTPRGTPMRLLYQALRQQRERDINKPCTGTKSSPLPLSHVAGLVRR